MICEEYNIRKATVHMTRIINGKKEEVHLCEECARTKETLSFDNSFSINSFLAGLLDINSDPQFQPHNGGFYQCSQCGATYDKFKQIGRLGCSQCYEGFKERLYPLIRQVQGNVRHIGKVPKRTGGIIRLKRETNQLKQQLKEAVQQQAFEKAAELRDQIRELEGRIEGM